MCGWNLYHKGNKRADCQCPSAAYFWLERTNFPSAGGRAESASGAISDYFKSKPDDVFATVASETDCGRLVLETGGDAHYAEHGYRAEERGAGYLQITHRPKQLEFLKAVKDSFHGADTATYIAENYPWESACWIWSEGKTSPAPNPNEYAKTRGNTPEVFLATQYGINGWTISDEALGKIVQGADYTVSEDGKMVTVDGTSAPLPKNWTQRLEWYQKAKRIWG